MTKKTEKLRHVVKKLSARYGANDLDVQRLQAELDVLVALESQRVGKASTSLQEARFQSPAKQLYLASQSDGMH
jgi:hypothetical protein